MIQASGITDVFIRAITVPLLAKIVGKVDGIKSFAGEQPITKQNVTPAINKSVGTKTDDLK